MGTWMEALIYYYDLWTLYLGVFFSTWSGYIIQCLEYLWLYCGVDHDTDVLFLVLKSIITNYSNVLSFVREFHEKTWYNLWNRKLLRYFGWPKRPCETKEQRDGKEILLLLNHDLRKKVLDNWKIYYVMMYKRTMAELKVVTRTLKYEWNTDKDYSKIQRLYNSRSFPMEDWDALQKIFGDAMRGNTFATWHRYTVYKYDLVNDEFPWKKLGERFERYDNGILLYKINQSLP